MSNIPDSNFRPKFVELVTSKGNLIIELFWDSAPKTCWNFATLAKREYYNNTPIHRIVKDRIVQAGDPTGTGRGGESIYGGYFADEIDQNLKHHFGMVASANAGPNMNKSQFYITLATCQSLDNKSTIFGKVTSGLDVLQRFNSVKTDKYNSPIEDLRIIEAKVLENSETNKGMVNSEKESDEDNLVHEESEEFNSKSYFIS